MKPVRVNLSGGRSYNIAFGAFESGVAYTLRKIQLKPSKILIVTSSAVQKAGYARKLAARLKSLAPTEIAAIPNGEKFKTLKTLEGLYGQALKFGLDRRSLVIGLGGGVVTDLAGYLAASYMRGVAYVSVPTTLLGMVDAAIGGKTGVDLPQGKNLVGAFWQPKLVWIDTRVLKTLSRRDWVTGFAEIIKYGVILDRPFFESLERLLRKQSDPRRWKPADLDRAVRRCAELKARVVSADEKEKPLAGGREILNFGHTTGHALEAASSYNALSHGEAISIGMVAAGLLALKMNLWSENEQLQLVSTLEAVGLPIHLSRRIKVKTPLFWKALSSDKKHVGGRLRFVLPVKMGSGSVQSGLKVDTVRMVLRTVGI